MRIPTEQEMKDWVARSVWRYNSGNGAYPGREPVDLEASKKTINFIFRANGDIHLTAEDAIVAGDRLVVRWSLSGRARSTGERWEHASMTICTSPVRASPFTSSPAASSDDVHLLVVPDGQ